MIGLNQFRYGNLFQRKKSGEILIFSGITPLNQNLYFTNNQNRVIDYYNLEIEAITLTEEWLVMLGFVKDGNGNHWINLQTHYLEFIYSIGYFYPVYAQIPEMSHEDEQRVSLNRIQSVHQLQNLYFALTGEELKLKD